MAVRLSIPSTDFSIFLRLQNKSLKTLLNFSGRQTFHFYSCSGWSAQAHSAAPFLSASGTHDCILKLDSGCSRTLIRTQPGKFPPYHFAPSLPAGSCVKSSRTPDPVFYRTFRENDISHCLKLFSASHFVKISQTSLVNYALTNPPSMMILVMDTNLPGFLITTPSSCPAICAPRKGRKQKQILWYIINCFYPLSFLSILNKTR